MDILKQLQQQVRRELLTESRKDTITSQFRQIPCIGPIRSALLVALIQTRAGASVPLITPTIRNLPFKLV